MKILIKELSHGDRTFTRDLSFSKERTDLAGIEPTVHAGITVHGEAETFSLEIRYSGGLERECGRCLSRYRHRIDGDFSFLVQRRGSDEPAPGETPVFYYTDEDDSIDIEQLLYEDFMLRIPMKSLCRDECPGLNAPKDTTEDNSAAVDSRWTPLLKLKNRLDSNR
ncbi:MAG: YceD family protein [Fibrobacterota bacterium]